MLTKPLRMFATSNVVKDLDEKFDNKEKEGKSPSFLFFFY